MLLGIDVGGTHTDAVAVDLSGKKARIMASCKVRTNHDDLLSSVTSALGEILSKVDRDKVRQLNLSTTLSTNAIVEAKTEDVAVLVSSGPGIAPDNYMFCKDFHTLDGSIDHRGKEAKRLDMAQVDAALESCRNSGIKAYAVVGKFSTRNPLHERTIKQRLCRCDDDKACQGADFVTMGHELGGRLNFPRRAATAYFNCAVWRLYNSFADAVEKSLKDMGLENIRVNVLKADGGTMPFKMSRRLPVQSILSGPAASVMGIVAMCDIVFDSAILDIGGTTTDIAIFASGSPLVEQEGIHIGSHPTLVRALKVHSIGIGGDSAISMVGDLIRVGPNRLGPSVAEGGERPTLVDALNFLGHCRVGDVEASRKGLKDFAGSHSVSADLLAKKAVEFATETIHSETKNLVDEINGKPVYTIHELLEDSQICPRKVYLMGGPAQAMKMPLFQKFRLSTEVPENYAVANAVGAALTRNSWDVELFADTEKNVMFIPSLVHRENIPGSYNIEDAKRDAMNHLLAHVGEMGVVEDAENAQITRASSFNMINGSSMVGRNIRVKCQIKPGVVRTL